MKIISIIILLSFSSISLTYAKSLNPLSNNQESINSGKKLYTIKCSKCHGPKAKGITNGHTKTPSLKKYKRQIIDQKRINEILKIIKIKSKKNNIDTRITNRIWKSMIWSYIDYQKRNFKRK